MFYNRFFSNLESGITAVTAYKLNLTVLIQVHHSLIAMGNILKGFENLRAETLNNLKLLSILDQTSQVIMITMENFIDYNIIRESIQFCIVRLYIILNNKNSNNEELLQTILSKFISCVMLNFDKLKVTEIINLINFISQVLHQSNNNENSYLLLQSLLAPFLSKIFYRIETVSASATDEFSKKEVLDLQRSVLSLIIAISNDHLNSLWLSTNENKEILVSTIKMVLNYSSTILLLTYPLSSYHCLF